MALANAADPLADQGESNVREPHTGIVRREFFETLGLGALGVGAVAAAARQVIAAEGPQPKWEQTSDRKVRIGVVGGGFGCGFQWHNHPNCVVEAVSDLQPERCKRLMEVYRCEKSYESLEKLVLDPKIEAWRSLPMRPATAGTAWT